MKKHHPYSDTLVYTLMVGMIIVAFPGNNNAHADGAKGNFQVDNRKGGNTRTTTSSKGVSTIDITTPSGAGVSHNRFFDYQVGIDGVILNNSKTSGTVSNAAGTVRGNRNLTGNEARLILNEVTGTRRSNIDGVHTIFGKKADFVFANPNGINCRNCNFVNVRDVTIGAAAAFVNSAGRVTLDTRDVSGTVRFSPNNFIDGRDYARDIRHDGKFNVVGRGIRVDQNLAAKSLKLIAGKGYTDIQDGTASWRKNQDAGEDTRGSLFEYLFGYFGKIGSDEGVRIDKRLSSYGDIDIASYSKGDVDIIGALDADGKLNIFAKKENINVFGTSLSGKKGVKLTALRGDVSLKALFGSSSSERDLEDSTYGVHYRWLKTETTEEKKLKSKTDIKSAEGRVEITSGQDIEGEAADITAAKGIALKAGGDVLIRGIAKLDRDVSTDEYYKDWGYSYTAYKKDKQYDFEGGSLVTKSGDIVIAAKDTVELTGVKVQTGAARADAQPGSQPKTPAGDIVVTGEDIRLLAGRSRDEYSYRRDKVQAAVRNQGGSNFKERERLVTTSLDANGGGVTLKATSKVELKAAGVSGKTVDITGREIAIVEEKVKISSGSDSYFRDQVGGAFFEDTGGQSKSGEFAVGSRVEAEGDITIRSADNGQDRKGELLVRGSEVLAGGKARFIAEKGSNIKVVDARTTTHVGSSRSISSLGSLFRYGDASDVTKKQAVGSRLEAVADIELISEGELYVRGGKIKSKKGDVTLNARGQVTIDASEDETKSSSEKTRTTFTASGGEVDEGDGHGGKYGFDYEQKTTTEEEETTEQRGTSISGRNVKITSREEGVEATGIRVKAKEAIKVDAKKDIIDRAAVRIQRLARTTDTRKVGFEQRYTAEQIGWKLSGSDTHEKRTLGRRTHTGGSYSAGRSIRRISKDGAVIDEAGKFEAGEEILNDGVSVEHRKVTDTEEGSTTRSHYGVSVGVSLKTGLDEVIEDIEDLDKAVKSGDGEAGADAGRSLLRKVLSGEIADPDVGIDIGVDTAQSDSSGETREERGGSLRARRVSDVARGGDVVHQGTSVEADEVNIEAREGKFSSEAVYKTETEQSESHTKDVEVRVATQYKDVRVDVNVGTADKEESSETRTGRGSSYKVGKSFTVRTGKGVDLEGSNVRSAEGGPIEVDIDTGTGDFKSTAIVNTFNSKSSSDSVDVEAGISAGKSKGEKSGSVSIDVDIAEFDGQVKEKKHKGSTFGLGKGGSFVVRGKGNVELERAGFSGEGAKVNFQNEGTFIDREVRDSRKETENSLKVGASLDAEASRGKKGAGSSRASRKRKTERDEGSGVHYSQSDLDKEKSQSSGSTFNLGKKGEVNLHSEGKTTVNDRTDFGESEVDSAGRKIEVKKTEEDVDKNDKNYVDFAISFLSTKLSDVLLGDNGVKFEVGDENGKTHGFQLGRPQGAPDSEDKNEEEDSKEDDAFWQRPQSDSRTSDDDGERQSASHEERKVVALESVQEPQVGKPETTDNDKFAALVGALPKEIIATLENVLLEPVNNEKSKTKKTDSPVDTIMRNLIATIDEIKRDDSDKPYASVIRLHVAKHLRSLQLSQDQLDIITKIMLARLST